MNEKDTLKMNKGESMDITWNVAEFNSEMIEEKDGDAISKWAKMSGTALAMEESKNGRTYTFDNLLENNGKEFNIIVGHQSDYDNPAHNVGEGMYILEGNSLKFSSKIRNTPQHPDIVEKVRDKLVAPSIQGGYQKMIRKDGKVTVEGLKIPLIALVNRHVRGVPSAVAAIEESLKLDEKKETEVIETEGDVRMADEDMQKTISERDSEIEKLKEQLELQRKESIVERILSVNDKLNKGDLLKLSEAELKLTEQYEKKLMEKKEDDVTESVAVVEQSVKESVKTEEDGVVIEKDSLGNKFITMSQERYKQFNKELRDSIYR